MRADNAIGNLAKPLWGTTRPHAARINSSITGIVARVLSTLPDVRAVIALHRVYAHGCGHCVSEFVIVIVISRR